MEIILSGRGRFGIVIGSDAILTCLLPTEPFPWRLVLWYAEDIKKGFFDFFPVLKKNSKGVADSSGSCPPPHSCFWVLRRGNIYTHDGLSTTQ
jgi:hypothetical protein